MRENFQKNCRRKGKEKKGEKHRHSRRHKEFCGKKECKNNS